MSRLPSTDVLCDKPLWPIQGCSGSHESFELDVALRNDVLWPMLLLNIMQKHISLLHNFWRFDSGMISRGSGGHRRAFLCNLQKLYKNRNVFENGCWMLANASMSPKTQWHVTSSLPLPRSQEYYETGSNLTSSIDTHQISLNQSHSLSPAILIDLFF